MSRSSNRAREMATMPPEVRCPFCERRIFAARIEGGPLAVFERRRATPGDGRPVWQWRHTRSVMVREDTRLGFPRHTCRAL